VINILRKIAETSGLTALDGEMYFPNDLSEIRDLQRKNLLSSGQQKALNEFIELVRNIEDTDGLKFSFYGDFWGDFASREARVDEKTLKQIEGYLKTLGVSYAKGEKSIIVDKYHHEAYSCGSSSWLLFILTEGKKS
jgi:hypothetical protein